MKHIHLTIFVSCVLGFPNLTLAQTDSLRIKQLVDKLSWKSISMDCIGTILTLTHKDSVEKELTRIGQSATESLIAALNFPDKTVIAHIILTQIFGNKKEKSSFSTKYIYKYCHHLDGWHNIYNGLIWEWAGKSNYIVRPDEIEKIKKYWTDKIRDNKDVSFDTEKIWYELDKMDESMFPCNKIYKNNSTEIKYQTLYALLGKKVQDPVSKKVWNILGNDSVMSYSTDCFFVVNREDGLEFRYEKDSLLSVIWIKKAYTGELPYNLKATDNKEQIEKKLGPPVKSEKFYDNSWSHYTNKGISFYFDSKGEIKEFSFKKK